MADYEFTETAEEELDFECSNCGTTEMPDITAAVPIEDSESVTSLLVDYHLTVECECGRETEANVWDKDVEEVDESE